MSDELNELGALIEAKRSECVLGWDVTYDELNVDVALSNIVELVDWLKTEPTCKFSSLVDITAVDYPGRAKRFDVVYHFLSMYQNQRIRLRVSILWHLVLGSPGFAALADRLWLSWLSAAQGLPDHGLYRSAL